MLYVNSERTASSRRKAYTRTPTYPCAFACTRSRMHSERRNMYACIRERKESTRVKTRGQYDVAKARRGCRRVPTRRERKTGTNGLSIKENAIDGEGKGDRARILGVSPPMSSISRGEGETKGIRGGKGENGENKRFIVGRTSSCAAKPLCGERTPNENGRCAEDAA